jgi:hypothetical protein
MEMADWLRAREPADIAKIAAYLLAPGVVLSVSLLGSSANGFALDGDRPVSLMELKSETDASANIRAKNGVVLIVEPVESEYHIPMRGGKGSIWTSLDTTELRANASRLRAAQGSVDVKSPFIGLSRPVTIVAEGDVAPQAAVLGGTQPTEDWRLAARRSLSIVSGVLAVCVFAFGMALPGVMPPPRREKHAAG